MIGKLLTDIVDWNNIIIILFRRIDSDVTACCVNSWLFILCIVIVNWTIDVLAIQPIFYSGNEPISHYYETVY